MALPAVRQRLRRLESIIMVDRFGDYPPLTHDEIVAMVERDTRSAPWSDLEKARMARQCPYHHGELMISAYDGEIGIKRYVGIDVLQDL